MDSSGYHLLDQYREDVIKSAATLIGRQEEVGGPPQIPGAPSPLVVMGAMNASFVTDGILYGIHTVLFAMCCYILLGFNRRRIQWFLLGAVCTMFAISTADIGLSIKLSTTDLWVLITLPPQASMDKMPPKAVLFVTNNLIADILLFHRCWVIWGRPRIILWIALVCLTADTIWGYLGHAAPAALYQHTFRPLYLWTVFALNVSVTTAAAGRIYWVSLVAIPPVERRLKRVYRAIISTIVESAFIYSSCILVFLLWSKLNEMSAYWVIPLTMMTRLVAIMPTLMIVQLGLSHRCYRPHGDCASNPDDNDSVILDTVTSARMQRDHDQYHVQGDILSRNPCDDLESGMYRRDSYPEGHFNVHSQNRGSETEFSHHEHSGGGTGEMEEIKTIDDEKVEIEVELERDPSKLPSSVLPP